MSTKLSEMKASLDVRYDQFILLRDFINQKVPPSTEHGDQGVTLLCGDLNVDSNRLKESHDILMKKIKEQNIKLTEVDK